MTPEEIHVPRSIRRFLLVALAGPAALAIVLSAGPARAQQQTRRPDRLFFATATLGIGDCDDVDCGPLEANTGPLPGIGAGIYVRPIPYFAAGVDLHFNWMTADDPDRDREHEGSRYYLLNFALRGIIPLGDVEPWGGVGFGFAGWGYSYDRPDRDDDRTLTGVDLAMSMGVDVSVADRWWIGGMFRLAFPLWDERCRERIDYRAGEPDRVELDCRNVDSLDPDEQHDMTDLLWYLGVTGRVDF